jgi:NCAIR mutase (PurE)-related protein
LSTSSDDDLPSSLPQLSVLGVAGYHRIITELRESHSTQKRAGNTAGIYVWGDSGESLEQVCDGLQLVTIVG